MRNEIKPIWRRAFQLAWESFLSGTVPVGCVIVDQDGNVRAEGRNAIFDLRSPSALRGTNMAHAEMIALSQLKRDEHPRIKSYTCYTTLEPCPMCFGAMVMMHIRSIKYGAKDGVAGSLALRDATAYLASKQLKTELAPAVLAGLQTALMTAFELGRKHPRQAELIEAWRRDCPEGTAAGSELYHSGYFTYAKAQAYTVDQVFLDVKRLLGGNKAEMEQ